MAHLFSPNLLSKSLQIVRKRSFELFFCFSTCVLYPASNRTLANTFFLESRKINKMNKTPKEAKKENKLK